MTADMNWFGLARSSCSMPGISSTLEPSLPCTRAAECTHAVAGGAILSCRRAGADVCVEEAGRARSNHARARGLQVHAGNVPAATVVEVLTHEHAQRCRAQRCRLARRLLSHLNGSCSDRPRAHTSAPRHARWHLPACNLTVWFDEARGRVPADGSENAPGQA